MKNKISLTIAVIVLITALCRIFYININAEKSVSEIIPAGETAEIKDNFFDKSNESMDGYAVTVRQSEIVPAGEYLARYGHTIDEQLYSDLEYYYIVRVIVTNKNNQFVGEKGIDFGKWYIQGNDYILKIEDFAYSLSNETVGNSMQISLRENSDMEFILPFYIFNRSHSYEKIYDYSCYLVISDYPEKLMLKL